jgi:hypothetical protein
MAAEYQRGLDDGFRSGQANGITLMRVKVEAVGAHLARAAKEFQNTQAEFGNLSEVIARARQTAPHARRAPPATASPSVATRPPQALQRPSNGQGAGVSRSQQKILDALAWLEGAGIAQPVRAQLALWAEVSPTSGGFFNNLGSLRSAGLIDYPSGGTVALTDAGREATQASAPPTTEEMQASVCQKVGSSKAAILRHLIGIYPRDIARDDLAGKIDVSPTSGGFFNNLGALRTLGVIDYPTPGKVVALPVLFLE